jgi:cation-transporting ATPase 13A3/4/5
LRWKKIFCISPQKINVAGRVKYMVFDKTGTLTEEDLKVHGFIYVAEGT